MSRKTRSHRWTVAVIIAITAAVVGWRYWDKVLRDRVIPRRFSAVEAGRVYRSGNIHPRLIRQTVTENGIAMIVSLNGAYAPDEAVSEQLGVELKQYDLEGDGSGDIRLYAGAIEDIVRAGEEGKPVLVHCAAGTMRTGAAVAFYRMLVQGSRDNKRIVAEMRKHGWKTRKTHLPDYINRHMYRLASILKARGVIKEVPDPIPQIESRGVTRYSLEELRAMDSATERTKAAMPGDGVSN